MKTIQELKEIDKFIKELNKLMKESRNVSRSEYYGLDFVRTDKDIEEIKSNNTFTIKIDINGGCIDRHIQQDGQTLIIRRPRIKE